MSDSARKPDDFSRTPPVFAEFSRPWLDRAAGHLPIWGDHPELADALAARLSAAAARVLVVELGICREAGILRGATSAERWRDFEERILASSEMRGRLQTEYPLLFPLLDGIADQFCQNLEECLVRLHARARGEEFKILRIETELSDPHARGRSVICFVFKDGIRLIYKPRSVYGEVWWNGFVSWWNASGVSAEMQLRAPSATDHGDYGWCEFIETNEDSEKSSAWFYRLGIHAAVTWLFGIGDCHFGNFLVAGEHPVLVDAECVGSAFWYPKFPKIPAGLPEIFTPVWKTPLVAGLFPPWIMPKVPGQPLYLAPGIGGAEDRPMPVKRPVWRGIGTDELHMELMAGLLSSARSRPGSATSHREISEGFRDGARHLLGHRIEILEWLGGGCERDPLQTRPRILMRNTAHYQQILEAASGPKYLASAENRQAALRTIGKLPVIGGEEPETLLDAETSYLEMQTYPRFVINEVGSHVVSDDGKFAILECDSRAVLELARQSWLDLSDGKIDWCAEILSAACRQSAEPVISIPKGKDRFLLAAVEIGEALRRQVIQTPAGACWMGLASDARGNVLPQTPSGDFAAGSLGVAVFLARLGEATGDSHWTELAVDAVRFGDCYWTRCVEFDRVVPWSAYHGAGSLFHAVGMAKSLMSRNSVREILERWLEIANRDRNWLKMDGDSLSGLPGLAAALAEISPDFPSARKLLELVLPRLLEPALSASLTTPGLAHGTAGWVMAVMAVARALGNDDAMRVARETIATFPEKWARFEARDSVRNNPPGGWCNGAIGLMATAAEHSETSDYVDEFFQKSRQWFAGGRGGHHFCCGEAGRVLLLSRVAQLSSDSKYSDAAQRCAQSLLDYADQHGFLILQDLPERLTVPGWLNGISGVGAAMLAAHSL